VLECCNKKAPFGTFTTDDVLKLMDKAVTTHEPKAWGAVMLRAAKIGWCETTDRYGPSDKTSSHRRPKRVWRSLVA